MDSIDRDMLLATARGTEVTPVLDASEISVYARIKPTEGTIYEGAPEELLNTLFQAGMLVTKEVRASLDGRTQFVLEQVIGDDTLLLRDVDF